MKNTISYNSSGFFYVSMWNIFLKRKMLFFLIFFCFISIAVSLSYFFPFYKSEALLLIHPDIDPSRISSLKFDISTNEAFISEQLSLLISRPILSRTLSDFYGKTDIEERQIQKLRSALAIKRLPLNNLVLVKLKWTSKEDTSRLLENLMEVYRRWFEFDLFENAKQVNNFLSDQISLKEKDLEKAEDELKRFLQKHCYSESNFPEVYAAKLKQISVLNENLRFHRNELTRLLNKETRIEILLNEAEKKELIEFVGSKTFVGLLDQLGEEQTKMFELEGLHSNSNSKVLNQEFAISELRDQIKKNGISVYQNSDPQRRFIENRLDSTVVASRISYVEGAVEQLKGELEDLNDLKFQRRRLERTVGILESHVYNLQNKYHDNKIFLHEFNSTNIKIISPPTDARQSNGYLKMALYGMLSGAFFNLILLYLLSFSDKYFHTSEMISEATGVPVLEIIPSISSPDRKTRKISDNPDDRFKLAFERLAARIKFDFPPPLSLNITSSSANAGKTIVAANLGLTMSRENKKVLILVCEGKKLDDYKVLLGDGPNFEKTDENLFGFERIHTEAPNLVLGKCDVDSNSKFEELQKFFHDLQKEFPVIICHTPEIDYPVTLSLSKLTDFSIGVACPKIETRERILKTCGIFDSLNIKFYGWIINEYL